MIHYNIELLRLEHCHMSLTRKALLGEQFDYVLALDVEILCEIIDSVLLILCH